MENILFCKNVAYIRLTNKAGYSHSEDFLHLAAVKQAYVAPRCKCEPARLLSQATCPNSAFAQNNQNADATCLCFVNTLPDGRCLFNTLPNKQSRIFATAKIFAPCRRQASLRRSAVQMRTSSLALQATCPNSAFAQNTKNTYLMVGVFFHTLPNKHSRIFA